MLRDNFYFIMSVCAITVKRLVNMFSGRRLYNGSAPPKPILYGDEASPPVRFALMTADYLSTDVMFHHIDLFSGENKAGFYTKINPLQKVPALAAGEEIILDSHAIALHLCRQSKSQDLYPANPLIQSKVEQMMFFNAGSLFPLDSAIFTDYFAGKWPIEETKIHKWYKLINYLEQQLNRCKWLAGDKVTLCDLCCAATITSLQLLIPLPEGHCRVHRWLDDLNRLPCFKINTRGLNRLKNFVDVVKIVNA